MNCLGTKMFTPNWWIMYIYLWPLPSGALLPLQNNNKILNRLRGFLESSVTEQLLILTNLLTSRKIINNDYCDEVMYGWRIRQWVKKVFQQKKMVLIFFPHLANGWVMVEQHEGGEIECHHMKEHFAATSVHVWLFFTISDKKWQNSDTSWHQGLDTLLAIN